MDVSPPDQASALAFVRDLLAAPVPRIALENPVSVISTAIRKPDQIVHPYMFGDAVAKATCLWLKGLPPLTSTHKVIPDDPNIIRDMPPGPSRSRDRSRTFPGLAHAMAAQWG
jgi:hypothetical protein